jgi:hypothetical protein
MRLSTFVADPERWAHKQVVACSGAAVSRPREPVGGPAMDGPGSVKKGDKGGFRWAARLQAPGP